MFLGGNKRSFVVLLFILSILILLGSIEFLYGLPLLGLQGDDWTAYEDKAELFAEFEFQPIILDSSHFEELISLPGSNLLNAQTILLNSEMVVKNTELGRIFSTELIPYPNLRYSIRASRRIGAHTRDDLERYDGSAWGVTERLRIHAVTPTGVSITLGAMTDKDKFERDFVDLYRVNLTAEASKWKLIAGDYNVTAGQGLTLWTKGNYYENLAYSSSYRRKSRGISPALESTENSSFRGVAFQSAYYGHETAVFAASTKLDAVVDDFLGVLRISDSGLHRTAGESRKDNTVTESTIGMVHKHDLKLSQLSYGLLEITGYASTFSPRLNQPREPRRMYPMNGETFGGASVAGDLRSDVIYAAGEVSTDLEYNPALRLGFGKYAARTSPFMCHLLFYALPREYYNHRAVAPKGVSDITNRIGTAMLFGLRKPVRVVEEFTAHVEMEKRDARSYTIPEPSDSYKASLILIVSPQFSNEFEVRLRRSSYDDGHGETAPVTRVNLDRLRIKYGARSQFMDRFGTQVWFEGILKSETGQLHYKGAIIGFRLYGGRLIGRSYSAKHRYNLAFSYFSTEANIPLYVTEASLPDRFSSIRVSGKGVRLSLSNQIRKGRYSWLGFELANTIKSDLGDSGDLELYLTLSIDLHNWK